MYWLYFARDFYRTGSGQRTAAATATASSSPAFAYVESTECAAIAVPAAKRKAPQPTPIPTLAAEMKAPVRKTYASKRQQEFAVHGDATPEPSPLSTYQQRLSIEGEHAFGVWTEEAGFSMFSANFERVTGLSSGECAGHEWIHLIHHTQQYAVNEALLNAVDGQDGNCLVQAQRLKEGAPTQWLLMDIKAAKSKNQNIMVLFRDLTEQKALEEALKQTESALAVSERSRAAFLSSMSHELRTPLNAIMGFSEMMNSGIFGELNNPTYKEYAKHIHDSGSALLTKINDLLDIASLDAGGLEIEEEPFLVSGMLAEVIQVYTHKAFERGQSLKLDCPHTIEITGDRAKLMCATAHLITNALRHSPNGSETTITLRVQADEGVIISVRDAGEGISTAQLETIRTALAADVAYHNIESGGIGLGLSLTKELAQCHDGRVMIDSVRHHGTVVSMILPTTRVVSGMPKSRRRNS